MMYIVYAIHNVYAHINIEVLILNYQQIVSRPDMHLLL